MALSLVTAPTGLILTIDQAKKQCLISEDVTDQDELFGTFYIPAATDRAELATRRALLTQTWDWKLDRPPACGWLEVPKPPLVSVTWIKYVDTNGDTQTWASSNYLVEAPVGPRCARGRIALAYGVVWPTVRDQMSAVTVRFVAGYGTADDVPALLRTGVAMDVGTLYENREQVVLDRTASQAIEIPTGSRSIYQSFKSVPTQR